MRTRRQHAGTSSFALPFQLMFEAQLTPVDDTHLLVRTEAVEEIKAALQEELEKNTYVKIKD